jgi:hypothetical protein
METLRYIKVPKEPTVEEAKRFVTIDQIAICVPLTVTRERGMKDGGIKDRLKVKIVTVRNESEMKSELVMAGPKRYGEVNGYLGIDGLRHYFSAKTGEAIGSQMRPIMSRKSADVFPPLGATR